ncbi:Retrotransposable element Tf2 155 kDa protein type 1 [Ceratocystis platani]|uniref:Retrotransposable element Tf2 155 kDa protein type 1 n=1 Tax=Ceratocystis fimbriata f. sp. platani TaxID=88771 RepID=A0A0F8BSH2_CERFI|nr:Retrotransposable element Tf2 155 kDa protein type 1 [Ceratocystis platani]
MNTHENPAPQPSERDNIAKILETLVAKLANDEQKSNSENTINLSGNLIFQDLQKLDNINWEKWSRQTIRNLRGYNLLHLFEGLEETDFKEAMQVEKSSRQRSMDESNAMAIIRAGLTEEDKKLVCDHPRPDETEDEKVQNANGAKRFGHTEEECDIKKKQTEKIIRSKLSIVDKIPSGNNYASQAEFILHCYGHLVDGASSQVHNYVKTMLKKPQEANVEKFLDHLDTLDPVTVNTVAIFTLDVSGQKENHVAWVVPELAEDLLIGYPWLKKKGALIDCEKDTVTFKSGIVAHGKLTNAPNFRSTLEQIHDVTKILHTVSQDSLHVFTASIDDINKALDRLQRDRQPADPNVWKKKVPHWIDTENVKAFDPDAQFTKKLPPRRPGHDHKIELTVPDEEAPWGPLYSMTREELVVLRQTLLALLEKGYIEESQSTAAAPILFAKKPGGGLRFCVDYRALNAVMKKNRYPLPNITETLKNVSKAKWFTKLDVVSAFHNIRIAEGDEWKTAFRTRHGLFQWKVMPFGLANAPAEFQSFLNSLLRPYLDVWLSACVDDILIYTDGTLEDHYEKVNLALKKILEGKLTIDIDKCEFAVTKDKYLGYILEPGSVSTDPSKVSAVTEWPTPKKIRDVRSFIPDFTKLANPLLQLTKKDQAFRWGVQEDEAFQELKTAFTTTPILCTHDPELPTIVEADASDYCLGAALLQKQADNSTRPCAYFSRKMTAAESLSTALENYPPSQTHSLAEIPQTTHQTNATKAA